MPALACLVLAAAASVGVPAPEHDVVAGGDHWRIVTAERGAIHVWRPKGYTPQHAGIVVYVHGYWTDVDEAWEQHRLAEQFDASGKDALFIAAEAPSSSDDEVMWPSLGDLLRAVPAGGGPRLPRGPIVVVGHSGAYRTLVGWLDYPPLRGIILLDALYGNEEDFLGWLEDARGHVGRRLTLVANDTTAWVEPFVKRLPDTQVVPKIPDSLDELPEAVREARVLYLRSQYGHMDIVTSGMVLPIVLQRARLPSLKPATPAPGSP